ncbi:DUF1552 domain-containing protein [Crateriforma conspicua]|uniref:DUF1552 domain-containing protein n=1 Tax=Crateriforma conspicua TaxID=2527996 RepID=A0A5C5YDY0_9PLAN|nr:DUF1552 domain-containing protein [Crateriforma conspicua]TWT72505.1 hypothetical protein Pan14r_48250 [Crateriforma conspicua]
MAFIRRSNPVSRRHLLRGAGVSVGLPWLGAMAGSTSAAGREVTGKALDRPPMRSAFLFMPNGVNPANWNPAATPDSDQFDWTPMLRPLSGVGDELILLENFHHPDLAGGNGHWPKVPAFLSGGHVLRTSGRDMDTGCTSIDQWMAQRIGHKTPLPTLELGVDSAYTGVDNVGGGFTRIYGSHIAWRDRHTPVPNEIVPQLAFDRLFRGVRSTPVSGLNPNHRAVWESMRRDETSVLDAVREDARLFSKRLGREDRGKLDEYLESVRSVERRIESSRKPKARWINEGDLGIQRPGPGIPDSHVEHVRLMMDIMVLAFWTDTTRIATFMMGNAQTGRNFSFIDGVKGSFHGLSHHRNEESTLRQYEAIGTWHIEQVAYLIDRMRNLGEGDGTLLDHCMVMFGSTLRDGNKHDTENLPLLFFGGGSAGIRRGRRLTAAQPTPLCNLFLSMAHNMGIDEQRFSTSTGPLDLA